MNEDRVILLKNFIARVSTSLPEDVENALKNAQKNESANSNADFALQTIQKNIALAKNKKAPLCQDTGFPTFFVSLPEHISQKLIREEITEATKIATEEGLLRPNSVDSITGKNSGNNTGDGFPKIVFSESKTHELKIQLILKGGGSENVSSQVSLPMETDFGKAGRDINGVEKAVLQIVKNAEGKGCAPGVLGVHVGSDRAGGYEYAKKNLFRSIGARSENQILAKLEESILAKGNNLGIGPMGFGGKSTLLEVFCSASNRVPASFFVTVCYGCWAMRKGELTIGNETIAKFENEEAEKQIKMPENEERTECKKLTFPLSNKDISKLKVGDRVELSGTMFTGRDNLHHAVVVEGKSLQKDISGSAIYHCGPVMKQSENGKWKCLSAGPTTSIREEPYQGEFIEKTGIKAVIGKGGMKEKTLNALKENNAVYFHAIGGAAAIYAEKILAVSDVSFLEEFGVPESMWEIEVKDFPVIVTMDAHGNSMH